MTITIRSLEATELETLLPALVALLRDGVNGGASLGFLPPLQDDDGRAYWRALAPEVRSGSRVVLLAFADDRLVGSGQLSIPTWSNAPHRAELQKLFVDSSARGQGVGRSLMGALHDAARRRQRRLVVLNTRLGDAAEHFYTGLGYRRAGLLPGYTVGPAGERYDNLTLYQELAP